MAKLEELIQRYRREANDMVEPYFVSDEDVIQWLNDAVNEACIRGRMVHESSAPDVCEIAVQAWHNAYPLHESLYEITHLRFDPGQGEKVSHLKLVSEEYLSRCYYEDWREHTGTPQFAIQSDTALRLVPCPDRDGTLHLEGYRTPLEEMVEPTDTPADLHKNHHPHLVQWVLHKAFSIPDTEFMDPNRAQIALDKFEEYFGLRPDSDLRRMTREDTLMTSVPFMP